MKEAIAKLKTQLAASLKINLEELLVDVFNNTVDTVMSIDDFYEHFNPEEISKGHCDFVVKVATKKAVVSSFSLRDMFGCCGVLVFHSLMVFPDYRSKGIGTSLTSFVDSFGRHYGYGVLQATDRASNNPQNKIFTKCGWSIASKFHNNKTSNDVNVWIRVL